MLRCMTFFSAILFILINKLLQLVMHRQVLMDCMKLEKMHVLEKSVYVFLELDSIYQSMQLRFSMSYTL